jgi:hypothetical protein
MERRLNAVQREVINLILAERGYQLQQWTPEEDQSKDPEEWLSILMVYMGKWASEMPVYQGDNFSLERFKRRIRQVTAIGFAILEAIAEQEALNAGGQT